MRPGDRVRCVEYEGDPYSKLIGRTGTVIGFREGDGHFIAVQLDAPVMEWLFVSPELEVLS